MSVYSLKIAPSKLIMHYESLLAWYIITLYIEVICSPDTSRGCIVIFVKVPTWGTKSLYIRIVSYYLYNVRIRFCAFNSLGSIAGLVVHPVLFCQVMKAENFVRVDVYVMLAIRGKRERPS